MAKKRTITMADLFCGCGGTSTGFARAAESRDRRLNIVAVNHWDQAVETHSKNHPAAQHHREDLTTMDPKKAVPSGKLDILVASPECTHHSVARGGVPMSDQSRSSAWCILRWASALRIDQILIENVAEFVSWGPLGTNGRPLKSRKGETFQAFLEALKSLGYRVEMRVLNSADYAAATSRRRLFLRATRGRRPIHWPEPTHVEHPTPSLFGSRKRWRAAREIINWDLKGKSIFNRKRPLVQNTLNRIEAGLRKFGGKNAEPFLVILRQHMAGRSIDLPLPTLAAGGQHMGLCEPFLVPTNYGEREGQSPRCHNIDRPLPTVVTGNTHGLVQPFIIPQNSSNGPRSVDDPLPTLTTTSRGVGICEPFILPPEGIYRGNSPRSVDDPMQTITAGRGGGHVVEPFAMHITHRGGDRVHSLDDPLPTITTAKRGEIALIDPFLVSFYGCDKSGDSVHEPLRTVTTKDRHGLVQPSPKYDILFRMLEPDELKQGMGFPPDYIVTGNREAQVKQIGNAVEVNQAEALGGEILEVVAV
jgi:DNA (cytosine-5)-methyltransferase 1